jgi:hypothetical protein
VVSAASILVGVLLAWWQLRKANQQSRAQFLVGLMAQRATDTAALDMFYRIEHKRFEFNESTFPQSADEKALDALLFSFAQVSTLYRMGTLTRRDLALIEYDLLRVYSNEEVQKYFSFLDRTPHGLATDEGDFSSYRQVAQSLIAEHTHKHRGQPPVQSLAVTSQSANPEPDPTGPPVKGAV